MCGLCGCSGSERDHHEHHDDANFLHTHHHDAGELVSIEQEILAKNQEFVEINRRTFLNNKITAINLMSSPGSGKTTLLAKAIADLKHRLDIAVIVGDQQTNYDAEKIQASGGEAIQINTGKVCHSLRTMEGRRPRCVVRDRLRFL